MKRSKEPWEARGYAGVGIAALGIILLVFGPIAWFTTHFDLAPTNAEANANTIAMILIMGVGILLVPMGIVLFIASLVNLRRRSPPALRGVITCGVVAAILLASTVFWFLIRVH